MFQRFSSNSRCFISGPGSAGSPSGGLSCMESGTFEERRTFCPHVLLFFFSSQRRAVRFFFFQLGDDRSRQMFCSEAEMLSPVSVLMT